MEKNFFAAGKEVFFNLRRFVFELKYIGVVGWEQDS